jgi:succinoglycan biosynthesis protein ExoM
MIASFQPAPSAPSEENVRIVITICTRGRPRLLDACLSSVTSQIPVDGVHLEIAVIENNEFLTCGEIVARHARSSGIPIHAVLEPELGIPFARNACGRFAAENDFDWLLYIDDDEIARPDWFATMISASRTYKADVLYGRVVPIYPEGSPSWMVPRSINKRPTGTVLTKAEGHNTLVRSCVFRSDGMGLRFDTAMRFTGGSDTDFFSRVHFAGGRIVWVGDAVVDEDVPASRMTVEWQLRRAFRVSINIAVLHEKQNGRSAAGFRSALKGAGRIINGLFRLPSVLVGIVKPNAGKKAAFNAAKQIASGLGSFAYLFGIRPQPYRQVDGD